MRVFFRKTIFGDAPGAARALLLDLPVDLFKGYWNTVVCPAVSRMSFDDAMARLREGITALFAPLGEGYGLAQAFYPSRLRNLILQAGSERRLMQFRYDGVTRVVEPYSLAFKRSRDGRANEYLYVWDRTGGRSSGPGIKSLFHYKIEQLDLMDESFEPRFEVELAKAGDIGQSGYFSQQRRAGVSRRSTSAVTRRARRAYVGPKYTIQCSYCGKQFKRKSSSTRLNPHKDRYGNQCYGRAGFIVSYSY